MSDFATLWTVAHKPPSFCPRDFPGKSTEAGSYSLLSGIFLTWGSSLAGEFFTTDHQDVSISYYSPMILTLSQASVAFLTSFVLEALCFMFETVLGCQIFPLKPPFVLLWLLQEHL